MRSTGRPARTRSRPDRRRGPVPYLIVGVIALWIVGLGAALFWGTGSEDVPANVDSQDLAGAQQAGSFAAEDTSRAAGGGEDAERASSDPSVPDAEPSPETPPAEEDYAEVDRGGETEDEPSGTRLPRAAAGGEDPPYDPLGTGADAGALSETDLSRARVAAFRFVDAAYDTEGSGPADRLLYLEEVNRTADAPEFWESPDSPGSDPAELIARKTSEYGVENRAVFGDFRAEETSSERVIGTATFTLDEGNGAQNYQQRLVLKRWAAVWRVLYAKPLEEV